MYLTPRYRLFFENHFSKAEFRSPLGILTDCLASPVAFAFTFGFGVKHSDFRCRHRCAPRPFPRTLPPRSLHNATGGLKCAACHAAVIRNAGDAHEFVPLSVLGVLGTSGWVWVRIYRGGRAILNALIPLRCARSGIEVPRPRS